MDRFRNFFLLSLTIAASALLLASCATGNPDNASTTATSTVTPPPTQTLTLVSRPQTIADFDEESRRARRSDADAEDRFAGKDAVINGSKVEVKLDLSGDLKGYMPHKDPATGKGNHIHVILDNQPYEAYYELGQPFELRNVIAGKHTLRVFPSRPGTRATKMTARFRW